ncbi:hypothetical protein BJX65DRAFT_298716 [Aspergillus insuetus]
MRCLIPLFAGLVGNGLLSAAVSGNLFASPSVQQLVDTITHVGGTVETLLVIMGYTDDVLPFHRAAEMARVAGYETGVLVVGDNVSVGRKRSRRGLVGTIFVQKILGAMAQAKQEKVTLSDLYRIGQTVVDSLGTVGVMLDHLGITDLADSMLDQLLDMNDEGRAYGWAGWVSNLEFTAMSKTVVDRLHELAFCLSVRTLAGKYMTSLDSKGIGITLVKTSDEMIEYLDGPVLSRGWSLSSPSQAAQLPEAKTISSVSIKPKSTASTRVVGDGDCDCGSTLDRAARAIHQGMKLNGTDYFDQNGDPVQALERITQTVEDHMDAASRALYAIFFNALASELRAIDHSGDAIVYKKCDTLHALEVLQRATPPVINALKQDGTVEELLAVARAGRDRTKGMAARFGRAVYVLGATWSQLLDPSAAGIVRLLEGFLGAA